MTALLFALISYVGWGAGDIFGTIATRKIGAYSTSFWEYLFGFVLLSFYAPFAIGALSGLTFGTLLLNILLGLVLLVAFVFFNEGLRIGNASLVGTIAASFASLVVVFSIVFFGEIVSKQQIVAIVIIFIGLLLSSLDFVEMKKGFVLDKSVLFAILTMLCWGTYFTFIKIPIEEIGWFWPNYFSMSMFPLLLVYMRLKNIGLSNPFRKNVLFALTGESVLVSGATLSYNVAISIGLASIVAPIAGSYPTLFVILAFLIFKDRIRRQQIAGIIAALIGIVLLSVFSV